MGPLETDLVEILNSDKGERAVHGFLKEHQRLVIDAFNRAWNFHTCVPEFELGNDFRADFLILSAHSGHWYAIFIELKPYNTRLYNKDGTPTKFLRKAEKQIDDWREWVRINEQYLRHSFSKILEKENAPAIWPHTIPNFQKGYDSGATEIADIRSRVSYNYHIVIGRSSTLTPEERKRRANTSMQWGGPEIATYDRFLAIAKRIDDIYRQQSN